MKTKLKKVSTHISKIVKTIKCVKYYWRNGGYTKAEITTNNYSSALLGRNVLVTGGTKGIGFSIAKKLSSDGANVVITGRDSESLIKAKSKIGENNVYILQWDISNIEIANEKINETENLLGGSIDILINNAGVINTKGFGDISSDDWDYVYSTNSKGLFFVTQELVNIWKRQKNHKYYKKIINISSTSGFLGATFPYRLSKWDLVGLTSGLGLHLLPYGIIVNGVAPGRTATQMLNMEEAKNIFDIQSSFGRYCIPEEIAEVVYFLCSDSANCIIGQTIVCDGGYLLN